jgi:hypothetical protein
MRGKYQRPHGAWLISVAQIFKRPHLFELIDTLRDESRILREDGLGNAD